jgi:hypothetical protein
MEIAGEWDSMSPASAIFFILESFKSDPTENQVEGTMSAFGCDHSGVELKDFLIIIYGPRKRRVDKIA